LTFQGRNNCGAGCNGSAWTDTAPNVGGLNGINTVITDPDFGARIVRVTDYTLHGFGASFVTASGGNQSLWSVDSSLFLVRASSGNEFLFKLATDGSLTTTITAIHNSNIGGDCPAPATSTPCTGATHFVHNGVVNFSGVDANTLYELDKSSYNGVSVNQINRLTIVRTNPNDPSTWTLTRVKLFNFNCEGAGCPATSATENFVNGFNIGTSSHNCLSANYKATWSSVAEPSSDDRGFTVAFSDDAQGGKPKPNDIPPKTGAVFVAVWNPGEGCRLYNSFAGTIGGDWGAVGPILGPDGVTPLLDKFNLHDVSTAADMRFSGVSSGNTSCADVADPSQCSYSCVFGKTPGFCENYYWENATRIIRPCDVQCAGHNAQGFINIYKGKQYRAHNYGSPRVPLTPLITDPIGFPGDNHGSYGNSGNTDLPPLLFATTHVCAQAPGMVAQVACDPVYTGPRYNEILGLENSITNAGNAANANGAHCNYGNGPAGCFYRFAHTFNTGSNWLFDTQNAMTTISPNGKYALFESDWNETLGCTDGTASNCMDSVTASGGGVFNGITYVNCPSDTSGPCQRSDVFIVDLTSAHVTTPDFEMAISNSPQTVFPSQSATFNGAVTALNGYSDPVNLSCTGTFPDTCTPNPTQVTPVVDGAAYTLSAGGAVGDYNFSLHGVGTDAGAITHDADATLHVVDFGLTAPNPAMVTAQQNGTSNSTTFQATAAGSFSEMVELSCGGLPAGATCNFSPSSMVSPTSAIPVTIQLTVSAGADTHSGQSTVVIQANTAGAPAAKTQEFILTVTPADQNPDFILTVTASPNPILVNKNVTWNGTLTAINGYNKIVNLSCTAGAPATCTIQPSALKPNDSFTVILGSPSAATYNFSIHGTDGGITHAEAVSLTVEADFNVTEPANPAAISPGQKASVTLDISPVGKNGFDGTVTFMCSAGLPPDASCSFAPAQVNAGAGPTAVTLTVNTIGPFTQAQLRLRGENNHLLFPLILPLAGVVLAGLAGQTPLRRYKVLTLYLTLALAGFLVACGAVDKGPGPLPISVSLTPTSANLYPNLPGAPAQTMQFTATVENTENKAVNWFVANVAGGNATVGTIDATGLYTAPQAVPNPAQATVKAVAQAEGSKSGSAIVNIDVPTASGTYPITVTVTEGTLTHLVTFNLTVN
jgi:hypothetical protein